MNIQLNVKNIEARKFADVKGPININNNSTVTGVSGSGDTLNVSFIFSCRYEPNIGIIKIEGDVSIADSEESTKTALDEWEGSGKKNLPPEIAEKLHNVILSNCMVGATIISKEIRLPAPIPTPKISLEKSDVKESKHHTEIDEDIQCYIR
jgi:hypothetical protein